MTATPAPRVAAEAVPSLPSSQAAAGGLYAPFALDRPDIVHRAVCAALQDLFPGVPYYCLFAAERGNQAVAWLRQVGMYVMAVRLDANQTQTARYFRRDRATVIYAIALVEAAIAGQAGAGRLVDLVEELSRDRLDHYQEQEDALGFVPEAAHG